MKKNLMFILHLKILMMKLNMEPLM
ncbi:unnamed protein product [Nezara viridula]|uniref:Uncharacterized protein n=1 Tax=Nezara viridula TaxID=85310 RepID=A0A9P0H3S0_NEZVI|nr:unnamed protein product [Nezara viridula]